MRRVCRSAPTVLNAPRLLPRRWHADGSLSIGAVGFVGAVVHGTDVFPLALINTLGDGGPQPPCPKAFAEPTHGLGITLLTPDLGPLTLQNGANPATTTSSTTRYWCAPTGRV